ncbi:MAG TPA: hypothetical protein VFW19_05790 [Allosphingosinicella sp.]|nr:hypothetical protein [Allosphingosinicella sp.]
MKFLAMAALAFSALTASPPASPPLAGSDLDRAVRNYKDVLAGRRRLADLPRRERRDLAALDRWLRAHDGIRPSETRDQCKARLASQAPSSLEAAVLDLKCSQRSE